MMKMLGKNAARLFALFVGFLVLLGIGGASASSSYIVPNGLYDISNVPKSFFVNPDGTPNVKIVVGSFSSAQDVASAADIAAALGSILYKEEEAKDISVVLRKGGNVSTVFQQVIYRYDYDTMTVDHNLPYNSGLVGWAKSYNELPGDYWYNGADYTANYSTWMKSFSTSFSVKNGDSVNGNYLYGWNIKIRSLSLLPIDPADWNGVAPPKQADVEIPPRDMVVSVDYTLYNYTVETEKVIREAYPEWGVPEKTTVTNESRMGNMVDVLLDTGSNATIRNVVSPGVEAGDEFTLLGKKYLVFSVGHGNFTAGEVLGTDWFPQNKSTMLGNSPWRITLVGADPLKETAIVTVVNIKTGELYGPLILKLGEPTNVVVSGNTIELQLKLEALSENLVLGKIAKISGYSNIKTYTSGSEIEYGNQKWLISVDSDGQYIKKISLTNEDELTGNPLDILGVYTVKYSFDMKSLNEKDVDFDINRDGNITDTSFVVAKATVTILQNSPVINETVVAVGDRIPGTDYVVAGVQGVKKVVIHTPTSQITILDTEVNFANPDSNYILVGSNKDNLLTSMIFGHYHLPVDFRVWFGDYPVLGYIPHCSLLGDKGVIIVAGSTPKATREAAVILMQYIAGLS
ncbi:S-layer protein [Thermococcus sp. Bubb.Bath]|uniref:S-layer protein n=1 Tax=Thermococcus sp. Bubb.Bath TaxID=1638242 RepID=UPI0023FA416D|nr:S-layer protein [Thermococcus sp. Bubb.Bath]